MRIALYHGYELTGSGSNEYTRYLAQALSARGHAVSVICSEQEARLDGVEVFSLPRPPVYPVYLTDKQRPGNVKAFVDLDDAELEAYVGVMREGLREALQSAQPDVLFANHLVMQPAIAAGLGVPMVVIPHGSAIEYAVKLDERYREAARRGLEACVGVVWLSDEVRSRVRALFPDLDLTDREHRVGIGTDTSRFTPVDDRAAALARLVAMQRPGGKRPAQSAELREALSSGDIEATQRYWTAYDHGVEDDPLPDIDPDADLILFMGALTYGKGVHRLIAAMPEVLRHRPKAQLLIVGSGTFREALEALVYAIDTGTRPLLEDLCRRGGTLDRGAPAEPFEEISAALPLHAKISDAIKFIGRLDHPRLQHLLPIARITAFPSVIKEASPLVFAESLAAGVLPAGADHSGFRAGLDALTQDLPDDLVEKMRLPQDIKGLANHLIHLLEAAEDPTLSERLRQIAVTRYDWSTIAEHLERVASLSLWGTLGFKPFDGGPLLEQMRRLLSAPDLTNDDLLVQERFVFVHHGYVGSAGVLVRDPTTSNTGWGRPSRRWHRPGPSCGG